MARPSCLDGAPDVARLHTEGGDVLGMGHGASLLLRFDQTADWQSVGDGWISAIYGEPEIWRNVRRLPWAIPLTVSDGRGTDWRVPAILSPLGTPCCDMASRLTDAGWVEEPTTPIARRAIDACYDALPHLKASPETLHTIPLDRQNEWILAVLEACYHIDALTIAKRGLITATLRRHGLRIACGLVDNG